MAYDADHARVKMATASGVTYYLNDPVSGALSEKSVVSSVTTWRDYIIADGQMVAEKFSGGTAAVRYFVTDHLGSVAVATDEAGNVVERDAYDAWGKRRIATTGADDPACSLSSLTTRGYTGHEQLDGVCLINANARMYDAAIGRFLSADSAVPDPADGQSFNRYAYVRNRPLSVTDPTGHADGVETVVVTGNTCGGSCISLTGMDAEYYRFDILSQNGVVYGVTWSAANNAGGSVPSANVAAAALRAAQSGAAAGTTIDANNAKNRDRLTLVSIAAIASDAMETAAVKTVTGEGGGEYSQPLLTSVGGGQIGARGSNEAGTAHFTGEVTELGAGNGSGSEADRVRQAAIACVNSGNITGCAPGINSAAFRSGLIGTDPDGLLRFFVKADAYAASAAGTVKATKAAVEAVGPSLAKAFGPAGNIFGRARQGGSSVLGINANDALRIGWVGKEAPPQAKVCSGFRGIGLNLLALRAGISIFGQKQAVGFQNDRVVLWLCYN